MEDDYENFDERLKALFGKPETGDQASGSAINAQLQNQDTEQEPPFGNTETGDQASLPQDSGSAINAQLQNPDTEQEPPFGNPETGDQASLPQASGSAINEESQLKNPDTEQETTLGTVRGTHVVVHSNVKHKQLTKGSVMYMNESRTPLGHVEEIFGPVTQRNYVVRLDTADLVSQGIPQGTNVSSAPKETMTCTGKRKFNIDSPGPEYPDFISGLSELRAPGVPEVERSAYLERIRPLPRTDQLGFYRSRFSNQPQSSANQGVTSRSAAPIANYSFQFQPPYPFHEQDYFNQQQQRVLFQSQAPMWGVMPDQRPNLMGPRTWTSQQNQRGIVTNQVPIPAPPIHNQQEGTNLMNQVGLDLEVTANSHSLVGQTLDLLLTSQSENDS